MPIDFSSERWAKIKENSRRWWAGQLDRPLIQYTLEGRDPGRPGPRLKSASTKTTAYDLSVSPEEIVDRWDWDLAGRKFLGDAFPHVWPDFGPGVLAAVVGAKPEPSHGTVWFHPTQQQEISQFQWHDDPRNIWAQRINAINRCALDRWNGLVQVGMTDLGGNLDVLSTFRPGEQLLLDLYDEPEQVKRLTWEAHELWWRYFDRFNAVLQPRNPGYTAWTPIFSEVPYYILQCDFCYMISPAMFDEFVKPELVASCRRLGNAFYHLDGPGQLPHLDSLLEIKELKGIQWVPGTGQADATQWPAVYRKIRQAGKLIQVWGNTRTLDTLTEQLGSAEGLILIGNGTLEQEPEIQAMLRRYGAEA